ncbi:hypothetical protein D3C87_1921270 [compost metagenome]
MDDHIRQPRNLIQQAVAARSDYFFRGDCCRRISQQTCDMIIIHQLVVSGALESGNDLTDFVLLLLSGIVSV